MRYAITHENNEVFQHFGKTPQFLIVDILGTEVSREVLSVNGKGHGALVTLLHEHNIDTLVCGGIGQGARDALATNHIELISGAKGDMDSIVEGLLTGDLKDDPSGKCNHHHEGESHNCAGHSCTN